MPDEIMVRRQVVTVDGRDPRPACIFHGVADEGNMMRTVTAERVSR